MDIGEKIRNRRIVLGLTQEEVAMRSELTKGFISQVERNLTSPSVDSLGDILEALGTNFEAFFKEEKSPKIVFSEEDYYESFDETHCVKQEFVVPDSQKNMMEPCLFTLTGEGESKLYEGCEAEDFCYVIEGKIELIFGEKSYLLKKGSCFYTDCSKSRKIINRAKKSQCLWVMSPPNF